MRQFTIAEGDHHNIKSGDHTHLTDLLVRQRELLRQLDLDKDEAGSTKVEAEEVRQAA